MYKPGPDLCVPQDDRDLAGECKVRKSRFGTLYGWLENCDLLFVKDDRREPLVVMSLKLWLEIVSKKEGIG